MLLQQGKINNCSNKEFTFLKLFSWTTKHHPCRIRHFPFEKHLSRKKEQFTYLHALLLPSLVIKRLSLLFYLVKSGVTVKVLIIYDNIKTFFFLVSVFIINGNMYISKKRCPPLGMVLGRLFKCFLLYVPQRWSQTRILYRHDAAVSHSPHRFRNNKIIDNITLGRFSTGL